MIDHHISGRFDVLATGEFLGDFDTAAQRERLLQALDADPDLCSALLCGERSLLRDDVDWAQAQVFAALMRDCGVLTEIVRHGEKGQSDEAIRYDEPVHGESARHEPPHADGGLSLVPLERDDDEDDDDGPAVELLPAASTARASGVVIDVATRRPLLDSVRSETVVSDDDGGDIPRYLLEVDARELGERRRRRRRWGGASLLVLAVALIVALSGGEKSLNSRDAYVHVLAGAVPASVDGVVTDLLVQPGQSLERGEVVAIVEPVVGTRQRQVEVAPEAGIVDRVAIRPGQQVQRGEPLLTMARPGSAYLLVYFTPEQLGALPQQAVVRIEFDDFPGQPVLGRLAVLPERGHRDGGARDPVRIDFEDQLPLLQRLRSGMAARVTIRLGERLE